MTTERDSAATTAASASELASSDDGRRERLGAPGSLQHDCWALIGRESPFLRSRLDDEGFLLVRHSDVITGTTHDVLLDACDARALRAICDEYLRRQGWRSDEPWPEHDLSPWHPGKGRDSG
jgi:hypothetical protein